MVIGPDFAVEARWAAQRFSQQVQCEQWLAEELRRRVVRLGDGATPKCQPLDSSHDDLEE
jgi:hypothetical protein